MRTLPDLMPCQNIPGYAKICQGANVRPRQSYHPNTEWARQVTNEKVVEEHSQQGLQQSHRQNHFVSLQQYKDDVGESPQAPNHRSHHLPSDVFHCIGPQFQTRSLRHPNWQHFQFGHVMISLILKHARAPWQKNHKPSCSSGSHHSVHQGLCKSDHDCGKAGIENESHQKPGSNLVDSNSFVKLAHFFLTMRTRSVAATELNALFQVAKSWLIVSLVHRQF